MLERVYLMIANWGLGSKKLSVVFHGVGIQQKIFRSRRSPGVNCQQWWPFSRLFSNGSVRSVGLTPPAAGYWILIIGYPVSRRDTCVIKSGHDISA